jgi:hypothetical protein
LLLRQRAVLALVLAASTALYVFGLDRAPVYLGGDEAHFAIGGHAIATTGRNVNGDRLPLFFNLDDPLGDPVPMPWGDTWYHPYLFYLIALGLKVLPFSEAAVRVPNALIGGLITPLLIFAAARKMRFGFSGALAAAVAVVLAPTHFILSREALDYTLVIPFAAGWAYFLADYLDTRRVRSALFGGIVLGVGCLSYIASWGALPMLLGVSWIAYWRAGRGWPRAVAASAAGFAPIPLIVVAWLIAHPTVLHDTSERYRILETNRPPSDQMRMASPAAVPPLYASYFGWTFLFRVGGDNITTSTGLIGVFLKPMAVLVPVGLIALWLRRKDVVGWPLVAGLLLAPLPAAVSGHSGAIQRALLLIPFAALIAGAGAGALWNSGVIWFRGAVIVLAAAVPLYMVPFIEDYLGPHRNRSAFYFDSINVAGVVDHLVRVDGVPAVFLRRNLDAAPARWRFHLTKAGRLDLLPRTYYFTDPGEAEGAPIGTRLVMYVEGEVINRLTASGMWESEAIVKDMDDREAAAILRKVR